MNELQDHINDEYKSMLVNHEARLEISNKEMGEVRTDIAGIKNDLEWLKKSYWVIASASISGLVIGMLNLLWK